MIYRQVVDILTAFGVEEIPALGEQFDPNLHNAVMHTEDEDAGENTIVEVFQAGFRTCPPPRPRGPRLRGYRPRAAPLRGAARRSGGVRRDADSAGHRALQPGGSVGRS